MKSKGLNEFEENLSVIFFEFFEKRRRKTEEKHVNGNVEEGIEEVVESEGRENRRG